MEDDHRSPVFLVPVHLAVFCLGTFLAAMCVFQINDEPSVPHIGIPNEYKE